MRLPSENPPGDEARVIAFIAAWLRERGIAVREIEGAPGRPNLVAELRGSGPGPTLLFNGHVDVVPAGSGWTVPPYGAEIRDGALYGRGACDMKGGLAAVLAVAEVFATTRTPFAGTLLLAIVCDEETGGDRGTGALLDGGHIAPTWPSSPSPPISLSACRRGR